MKHKKILILGNYPVINPQHGGQKRTAAIIDRYKKEFSDVRYVAIFYKSFYSDHSRNDIAVGQQTIKLIKNQPDFSDIYCGEAIYNDPIVRQRISQLLDTFKPDVIHVEQPYTYLGLKPLLSELQIKPKLIYGSQNVEYQMKQEIFQGLAISRDQAKVMVEKIKDLETDLAKDANILVVVSDEDSNKYKTMGATHVVLAPNGITRPSIAHHDTNKSAFPRESKYVVDKRILFVGSAHQPNWVGFEKMVGVRLGFLSPRSRIYLVGGVSDYFVRAIKKRATQDVTFWQRAMACGLVSERRLIKLLSECDVIILPITEGGGSNLKTAEAFVADKNIVATRYAMRTYEYLEKLPNLYLADTPEKFRESILQAINEPHKERSNNERQLVERVLWDNCLNELIKQVSSL